MGESDEKLALLAGASGLVGAHVLDELLLARADFARVYAVTRRPLGREHSRLANRIVQFERLEGQFGSMRCHTAFCCIGVAASGGDSAARKSMAAIIAFARAAKAAQAQRFVLLSCAGAGRDARRPELRAQGEAEDALAGLGFASLDILKPGVLYGLRRELRPLDLLRWLTPLVNPVLAGPLERFKGLSAQAVAVAMVAIARSGRRGVNRYDFEAIRTLAGRAAGATRGEVVLGTKGSSRHD
jgi:uncharacterized protein YbjT (DUF2867 family)